MIAFAFDRDWTVDVNPHPDRQAVPLEWVRHLARETDHAVYAIGNQRLVEEAAIPGVVDIVERHPDDRDRWLGARQSDGRYERFPTRRERLSLIADLHPDARCIVVDDIDLGDVDGWEHYHPWGFVPAIERGEIDPSLPWVRDPDPRADGGLSHVAGIAPANALDLSSFLDDHDDAPAYELTYADGGTERTRLLHDASLAASSLERPSARALLRCTPLASDADRFGVDAGDVERLAVVEAPPELYTRGAETPAEEATALRRLAETHPDAVAVPRLLGLLDREAADEPWLGDAVEALRHAAVARPGECTPGVPVLRSLLAGEGLDRPGHALATLRAIGDADPADIAPVADEIVPYLSADSAPARYQALRCIGPIAEEHPEDAVAAVPALATVAGDGGPHRSHAVYALSRIAREYPLEVRPVVDTLGAVVLDESADDTVRLNATAALGHVTDETPEVAVGIVDDVTALFDADNHKLRNNGIALLADVATVHTDVVEPHVDAIAPLLTADDDYTRVNASGALARVAADFPGSVDHLTPRFVALLADGEPLARENACWALGHLAAEGAERELRERALEDDERDVRTRAEWALARIDR